ncbi:integral membrane protein [Scardovia inopinata]|uniref:DUF624 domain-containing protein n=1 Tax=Scardovia inopinata TaxID=78259 RepID=UPI000E12FEF8|nr:DUF624 domain-containing protein [Scardovia inopinata]SUV62712.1 integral membrane protein [Scardovia inopinata]
MSRFFSQDSPFMRGLWWFTDIVIINVYFLLTCLPVITIGAALSAAYDAARKSQESRGNVSRNYFKAFTSNFVQATIIWLPLAALGAGLIYAWIGFQVPLLLPFKAVLTFVYLMCFWWVFPLQSRFPILWAGPFPILLFSDSPICQPPCLLLSLMASAYSWPMLHMCIGFSLSFSLWLWGRAYDSPACSFD